MLQANHDYRVVCFGDSTTAPRDNVDIYTDQLRRLFPEITFINRGVRGESTSMALKRLETDVLDAAPDIVIIQFGINDAAIDVWKKIPAERPRVALEDYAMNLRNFVDAIHGKKASAVLMTPNQVRWTPDLVELYGRPPYQVSEVLGFTFILETYATAVRDVATEKHVPLVDIYTLYEEWECRNAESCSAFLLDGIHPNSSGHQLVATKLADIIGSIFRL